MSFGFSPSDVVALVNITTRAYRGWKNACGEYSEITGSLDSLLIVVGRIEDEASKPNSVLLRTQNDGYDLKDILYNSGSTVRELHTIIARFKSLGSSREKNWDRLQLGVKNLDPLRVKLTAHIAAITAYLNAVGLGALGRIERDLNAIPEQIQRTIDGLAAEIRAGRREGSIMTTYSDDEKEVWKQLRRELIGEGVKSATIHKFKPLIRRYLKELADRGELEELPLEIAATEEEEDGDLDDTPSDSGPLVKSAHAAIQAETPKRLKQLEITCKASASNVGVFIHMFQGVFRPRKSVMLEERCVNSQSRTQIGFLGAEEAGEVSNSESDHSFAGGFFDRAPASSEDERGLPTVVSPSVWNTGTKTYRRLRVPRLFLQLFADGDLRVCRLPDIVRDTSGSDESRVPDRVCDTGSEDDARLSMLDEGPLSILIQHRLDGGVTVTRFPSKLVHSTVDGDAEDQTVSSQERNVWVTPNNELSQEEYAKLSQAAWTAAFQVNPGGTEVILGPSQKGSFDPNDFGSHERPAKLRRALYLRYSSSDAKLCTPHYSLNVYARIIGEVSKLETLNGYVGAVRLVRTKPAMTAGKKRHPSSFLGPHPRMGPITKHPLHEDYVYETRRLREQGDTYHALEPQTPVNMPSSAPQSESDVVEVVMEESDHSDEHIRSEPRRHVKVRKRRRGPPSAKEPSRRMPMVIAAGATLSHLGARNRVEKDEYYDH